MPGSIGREEQLAVLERARASAASGTGRIVVVSGEAGAGKSTLVRRFGDLAARDADVLIGYCDPLSTPRPAGPLIDIAGQLGGGVDEMLAAGQRRGLFDAALTALATAGRPRIAVFEDIHWADELTLELLGFLARRVASVPVLVVATYRDDQVGGDHPTRALLGSIGSNPAVERLVIPPLSLDDVVELAAGTGVDPRELYRRTGGNAFFVTEVLAAPSAQVPAVVADAVVARCRALSPEARRALLVSAVIGARVEPGLLLAIDGVRAVAMDECVTSGLMTFEPPAFRFRHELTRQAVLGEASSFALAELHGQVLAALREFDARALARLADHAECAGDGRAVLELAPKAADRAARLGSHREAARQLQRALAFADREPDEVRAALLADVSYERYLIAELAEALEARRESYELHERGGRLHQAADALRWMSRISWYIGRRVEAVQYARRSADLLEPAGPSPELGMAYSNQSQLLMLAGHYTEAIARGEQALAIAEQIDDDETRAHALNNIGTSKASLGHADGVAILEASLELALARDLEDHAARAYVNLGGGGVDRRDMSGTERYLDEGREYCRVRELDLQWIYLEATRALWLLHRGRWAEAEEASAALLALPMGRVHRFVALIPLVLIRIRRGEPYEELLAEVEQSAATLDEPQRTLPVVFARAEAAWLAGTLPAMHDALADQRPATEAREDAGRLSELHHWLARANPTHVPPPGLEGPFAVQIAGPPSAAAAAWLELSCPYDAAVALLDGDEAQVREAYETFRRLGAEPAGRLAQARLRELGVRVPRGPRRSTADNPFGLTSREDEVLHLLAQRLTNTEIAARLVLSERTVHHHVSALLAKLGVSNRVDAGELGRAHEYGQAG